MKQFFKELFDYNHHFNQQLGDIFTAHPDKISDRALSLYSHLLNAHQIWNNRIAPKQTPFGVWDLHPIEDCKDIDQANYTYTLLLLDTFDLEETRSFTYSNTKGQACSNSLRDMLFHIINHATYHRGQIATEMRQCGMTPLMTDYIFYKR